MPRYYPRSKLIAPIFVDQKSFISGSGEPPPPLRSIPGFQGLNRERALAEARTLHKHGICSILIYPLFVPGQRQETLLTQDPFFLPLIRSLREECPDMQIILDLCLCHLSQDGQCGLLEHEQVDNTLTLSALEELAPRYAASGADALMLSGMTDGAVAAVRRALDDAHFQATTLMVQSAKLDSSFYGPFQKLKPSVVHRGLKATYQLDPANRRQARREIQLDLAEGADMVVLKPISGSLDLLPSLDKHNRPPVLGYMTGGEYALLKETLSENPTVRLRQLNDWLCNLERAGLDAVFCYIAAEYAHLLHWSGRQTTESAQF